MGNRASHEGRGMSRRLWACLRTLVVVSVVGVSLFGNLTAAQAATSQEVEAQAASPCDGHAEPCCALGAMNPRMEGGRVVGQGDFECNFQSEFIILSVQLVRDGVEVDSNAGSVLAASSIPPVNVSGPCAPGRWQTIATATYVLPWGEQRTFSSSTGNTSPCAVAGPPPCPPNLPNCHEP
jgi:hypothetical protein